MTDEANELRDGAGPLPAELRGPLADLLDALDRWEWVGTDTAMDEWVGATRGLHEAYRVMRGVLAGNVTYVDTEAIAEAVSATPPPTVALDIIERIAEIPDDER